MKNILTISLNTKFFLASFLIIFFVFFQAVTVFGTDTRENTRTFQGPWAKPNVVDSDVHAPINVSDKVQSKKGPLILGHILGFSKEPAGPLSSCTDITKGSIGFFDDNLLKLCTDADLGGAEGAGWNWKPLGGVLTQAITKFVDGDNPNDAVFMAGNVGIGTTTPAHKLDVAGGDIQISTTGSGLIFPDGTKQTTASTASTAGVASGWLDNGPIVSLATNSDRVGIGTTIPDGKLEIRGAHSTTKMRLFAHTPGQTDASLDMWASEPYVTWDGSGIGNNVAGHPFYGRRNNAIGQSLIRFHGGDIHLAAGSGNATTRMFIRDNGNVGIGTTAPRTDLELAGTMFFNCDGCGSTTLLNGTENWGDLSIQGRVLSANSNLHLSPPAGFNVIINDTYRAAGGTGGGSAGLIVEGDVGIGMLTPSRKLHVHSDEPWKMRVGGNQGYIDFGPGNTSWAHIYTDRPRFVFNKLITTITGDFASYNTDLVLKTDIIDERLRIDNVTGNVGIGTSTPDHKLDVEGSIRSTNLSHGGTTALEPLCADQNGVIRLCSPPTPPTVVSFTASRSDIIVGEGVTFTWNVNNADTCELREGFKSGRRIQWGTLLHTTAGSGSFIFNGRSSGWSTTNTGTEIYSITLHCKNAHGQAQRQLRTIIEYGWKQVTLGEGIRGQNCESWLTAGGQRGRDSVYIRAGSHLGDYYGKCLVNYDSGSHVVGRTHKLINQDNEIGPDDYIVNPRDTGEPHYNRGIWTRRR